MGINMVEPGDDKILHEAQTSAGKKQAGVTAATDTSLPTAGRYRIESKLGAGAMGEVYKAYDPGLARYVALKFLRGDDPEMLARFQQEARAQARLENKNICKVYEVGDADGRPFIAMQYIAGQTLSEAANHMTLEQKVAVVRDVAEALHSAHKLGFIHRDIKPANIMVERTEEGSWQAYIMDFGLVRDQAAKGMTVTGIIMGTIGFMAPEQLRGEVHSLDRRADVYGLGATLYALLLGRAPFGDEASVDVMMKVLESEPASLVKIDASIPADLETIVMKCLEKEPHRRYDSARMLAEDLQHYLDGEAIQARRSSLMYRLAKKAQKHRALVAVSAVALLLILVLGGFTLRAQLAAAKREELAQRFGQQIKEIESIMRISHLVPLHDTRMEKELIRRKMNAVEKEDLGEAGKGPASYALGKGHLLLHEYEAARQHLEDAWNAGYRSPEVAYALGQVMGTLYSKEMKEAERLGSEDLIAARKKQIENEYRDPALAFLKQSRGTDLDAPEYLEALLAFYGKHYDEALRLTRSVYGRLPWLYEARMLEGNIHRALADEQVEKGSYEPAREAFAKAESAFQSAMDIAHSDSQIYEDIADLNLDRMEMEIYGEGKDVIGYSEKGLSACEMALRADPESANALHLRAGLYSRIGEYQRDHGQDPRPSLQKSIEASEQSAKMSPDIHGYESLQEALRVQATYELDRGINPGETVRRAYSAYQQAIRLSPTDPDAHNTMGICFRALGGYEGRNGKDPRASLQKAIDSYHKAIESSPRFSYPYNNAGNTYAEIASYELDHGMDPRNSVEQALRSCEKAVEINPNFPYPYNNMATALNLRALYEIQHNLDPKDSLQKAVDYAQKGAQVKSTFASVYGNMAHTYQIQAQYELKQGEDPRGTVHQAIEISKKALEINPQFVAVFGYVASAYVVLARYEVNQRLDPSATFKLGLQTAQKALELNPGYIEALLDEGLIAMLEGQWRMGRNQNPSEAFSRSRKIFEQAVRIKAGDAQLRDALAELSLLEQPRP